jgi:hypothetical protein
MGRYDWPAPPRGEDDPGGRARYLTQLRPTLDPTTIAPLTPKKSTRRRARAVPHNAPSGANNLWFPIGPSVMTNGQAGGNPNVAGRIRDLIVEPTAGLRIYAASGTGGVWFSADRGETWTPLDEFQESDRTAIGNLSAALACGAVHVRFGAAADGSQDEVWIGTGEQSLSSAEALPVGPGGGLPGGQLAGIGFLHLDPSAGPGWTVVKGGTSAAEPDTLRGESFYRIAADPGNDTQLVAGTTKGLYVLPAGGSWTKVASYPTTWDQDPLDVVLTRLTGPDRVRIWVGVTTGVLVAEFAGAPATPINPASLVFTPVRLDNIHVAPVRADGLLPGGTRVQLATDGTTVYVLGRRIALPADKTPPAHAWRIDATVATAALAALRAAELTGVPPDLFMSAGDQSSYDMCIAVHPTVAGRLYVGGAAASTSTGWNGSIYRCELAGTTLTPTLIGEGTHPDVHVLRVGPIGPPVPAAHTVWVGCDGGLFRSDSDGDPNTFVNRNDGLAVLQPGYVASHPTNPGIVVAGFQDNGTAIRVGDGVWEQKFGGDGGGVVFDPASDNRYFRQYVQATWNSSDNRGTRPVLRRRAREKGSLKTSETVESGASLFYSGADAVVHGGDTHLAFGSDRVWYSRDWGGSWVTLPTATDPRGGDNPNLAQDVLLKIGVPGAFSDTTGSNDCCSTTRVGSAVVGHGIIAVKFSRLPEVPTPADILTLRVLALYPLGLVWFTGTRAAGTTGAFAWARPATFVQQAIRAPLTPTEVADFGAGHPLAFLPAAGVVSDVAVHDPTGGTLGSCYVTTTGGSVGPAGGPFAPLDTLWFFDGVDKWFPTGLRINLAGVGNWGTGIRVTAPALGVVVDPDDKNSVYVATSVGVVRGVLTIGGTVAAPTYAWAWSQFMNGLPEAAVQDLSIRKYGSVTLLRAALQSRGVWETDLATPAASALTYLRAYRTDTRRLLPTQLSGPTLAGDVSPALYDDSPDIVIDTTGVARITPPTEAELAKIPAQRPASAPARLTVTDRHPQVHVLVHHRWSAAAPPAQVRVALLRHALPANGVLPLGGLWPVLVAAAAAGTSPALPDGWTKAAASLSLNPSGPVEPRLPRAVTFTVDLSADAAGSAILLMAVVLSATNQISPADLRLSATTQAATADQLVMSSPHVAAKSIVIR